MKVREILGHIDCPTCGTKAGMRITHDKNGDPFGYCEAECHQQMRIGGDKWRVDKFLARFPWAAGKKAEPAPAPVAAEKKPAPAPVEERKPAPAPRSAFADAVAILGGARA